MAGGTATAHVDAPLTPGDAGLTAVEGQFYSGPVGTFTDGPNVGQPEGPSRLEYLSLDNNQVTDLTPLSQMLQLKALSLRDGAGGQDRVRKSRVGCNAGQRGGGTRG